MSNSDGRSRPRSATEFMAELARDPEYRRRKAEHDAESAKEARRLASAEQPILADLRGAGVTVASVWDLVNTAEPYPAALPVLMDHLELGGYPDRVMESLGRALAVKPSVVYWERLKDRWLHPRGPGEEDGSAVALAACATREKVPDLLSFLALEARGESRVYFVRPTLRLGGELGRVQVEALRDHPVLGKEATALLRTR